MVLFVENGQIAHAWSKDAPPGKPNQIAFLEHSEDQSIEARACDCDAACTLE